MGAMAASHGAIRAVTDAQILDAYRFLAAARGRVLRARVGGRAWPACSPTAPTSARRVVCVLTGHGLKDPQTALGQAGSVVPCEPDLGAVERAVLG